jgi:hypothetical protein
MAEMSINGETYVWGLTFIMYFYMYFRIYTQN